MLSLGHQNREKGSWLIEERQFSIHFLSFSIRSHILGFSNTVFSMAMLQISKRSYQNYPVLSDVLPIMPWISVMLLKNIQAYWPEYWPLS